MAEHGKLQADAQAHVTAVQAEAKLREEAAQHQANTIMSEAAAHTGAAEQALIAKQCEGIQGFWDDMETTRLSQGRSEKPELRKSSGSI